MSRTLLVCSRSRPEGVKCTLRFPVNFKRPALSARVSKGATDAPFARVWFDPLSASPQLTNAKGLRCVPFALTREFFKTEDNVLECLQICDFIERRGLKFRQQRLKSARVQ